MAMQEGWVLVRAPKYDLVVLSRTEYEVVLGRTEYEYDRKKWIQYESVRGTTILLQARSY